MTEPNIEILTTCDPRTFFPQIISLWRANSNKLGELPRPEDKAYGHLHRQQFYIAIDGGKLAGYLMYRKKSMRGIIKHLCIDPKYRKMSIASTLVTKLIRETNDVYWFELDCRRDYGLDAFWSKCGFSSVYERGGRSLKQHRITHWRCNYRHPNLMSELYRIELQSKIPVAIDTNIFFDLLHHDEHPNTSVEDSVILESVLVSSQIQLYLTSEVFNDFNRNKEQQRREQLREIAKSRYPFVDEGNFAEIDLILTRLQSVFPAPITEQDYSDIRCLAKAISGGISLFVTRDQTLLSGREDIESEFHIQILRPSELVIHLDEIPDFLKYQPERLAGTKIEVRPIKAGDQDLIINNFLNCPSHERKICLKQLVQAIVSDLEHQSIHLIWSEEGELISVYALNRLREQELQITLFRYRDSFRAKQTLIRHLILSLIKTAVEENREFVNFTDRHLQDDTKTALSEDRFIASENILMKWCLPMMGTRAEIKEALRNTIRSNNDLNLESFSELLPMISSPDFPDSPEILFDVEKTFFPVKFIDPWIHNFIIAIKPEWAEELFDEHLASQNLFGVPQDLALRREMVYYRINRLGKLRAPGRILWYVSESRSGLQYGEIKAVRACSRLEEIIVDEPAQLHRQFKRLGVYSREMLDDIARSSPQGKVMALRFSDTELFQHAVSLNYVWEVISKQSPFLTPQLISPEDFRQIYAAGVGKAV